jgi:class I fructose-bisphosphate aldolase
VVVALDHGIAGITPLDHLEKPRILMPKLSQGGADAIIVTPGIARSCSDLFTGLGLILRIDGGATALSGEWDKMEIIRSVEDALRLGADAVIMMGTCGTSEEARSLANLGLVAARCDEWGLPLIAEMLPGGFGARDVTINQLAASARLGAELGADVIKLRYQSPSDDYQEVTRACYVPVITLGGPKQSPEGLIQEIQESQQAGACGVAVGRNIWQAEYPENILAQIVKSVHSG